MNHTQSNPSNNAQFEKFTHVKRNASTLIDKVDRINLLDDRIAALLAERDQLAEEINASALAIAEPPKRGIEAIIHSRGANDSTKSAQPDLSWMDEEVAQSAGGKTP